MFSSPKYSPFENAAQQASDLKQKGHCIVFTNGCFDILHAGHIHYLKQAKIVDQKRQIILEKLPPTAQDAINSWERSSQLKLAQPFLFARFKALQEYANSEAYQKLLSAKSDSPNSVDSQNQ